MVQSRLVSVKVSPSHRTRDAIGRRGRAARRPRLLQVRLGQRAQVVVLLIAEDDGIARRITRLQQCQSRLGAADVGDQADGFRHYDPLDPIARRKHRSVSPLDANDRSAFRTDESPLLSRMIHEIMQSD